MSGKMTTFGGGLDVPGFVGNLLLALLLSEVAALRLGEDDGGCGGGGATGGVTLDPADLL